jgi:hypothetical protein
MSLVFQNIDPPPPSPPGECVPPAFVQDHYLKFASFLNPPFSSQLPLNIYVFGTIWQLNRMKLKFMFFISCKYKYCRELDKAHLKLHIY